MWAGRVDGLCLALSARESSTALSGPPGQAQADKFNVLGYHFTLDINQAPKLLFMTMSPRIFGPWTSRIAVWHVSSSKTQNEINKWLSCRL